MMSITMEKIPAILAEVRKNATLSFKAPCPKKASPSKDSPSQWRPAGKINTNNKNFLDKSEFSTRHITPQEAAKFTLSVYLPC